MLVFILAEAFCTTKGTKFPKGFKQIYLSIILCVLCGYKFVQYNIEQIGGIA